MVSGITQTAGALTINSGAIDGGFIQNGGTFTMAGGTVNGGLTFNGGTAAVNGGTVNAQDTGAAVLLPAGSAADVSVNGGRIDGKGGKIFSVLSDQGTFTVDTGAAIVTADRTGGAIETGAGCTWTLIEADGTEISVGAGDLFGFQEGEGSLRLAAAYTDLKSALSSAADGTRITLEEDYTDENTDDTLITNGTEEAPVVLDLDGHTMSMTSVINVGIDAPDGKGAFAICDSSEEKAGIFQADLSAGGGQEFVFNNQGSLKLSDAVFTTVT